MDTKTENAEIAAAMVEFFKSKVFLDPLPWTKPQWIFDRWEPFVANSDKKPDNLATTDSNFKMWPVASVEDACEVLYVVTENEHPRELVEQYLDDPSGPVFVGVYAKFKRTKGGE